MTNDDERRRLAAAEEIIRLSSIKEMDRVDKAMRSVRMWPMDFSPEYMVLIGGRETDQHGVVINHSAGSRPETARYSGARGLVEAWAVIEQIKARAASLGASVDVTVKVRWSAEIKGDWVASDDTAVPA